MTHSHSHSDVKLFALLPILSSIRPGQSHGRDDVTRGAAIRPDAAAANSVETRPKIAFVKAKLRTKTPDQGLGSMGLWLNPVGGKSDD
jgi:hypothetical protein